MMDFLFGSACERGKHTLPSGLYHRDPPYLDAREGPVDGIGHQHVSLWARCEECGKEYHVANVHASPDGKLLFDKKD